MESRKHVRRERALDELAALHRDLETGRDHRLRRGCAERHDDMRLDGLDLPLEPLVTGVDLALRRGLVQAALATQLPLEVLDRIGDIEAVALDARGLERAVEEPPRPPD